MPPELNVADLPTVDIEDVELLRAGGPYFGHGSPPGGDHLDRAYLDARVRDTHAAAGVIEAPFKLGHNAEQRLIKALPASDGHPAGGWLDAASVRREGDSVRGTLRRVPARLAQLIKAGAWRKISAEWKGVVVDGRKLYPFIGVSALGAELPAIDGIDDIIRLYEADPEADAGDRFYADIYTREEPKMDKALRKALGLADDATDEQVEAAVAILTASASATAALAAALGVKNGETIAEAFTRREAEQETARKADIDALRAELTTKPSGDIDKGEEARVAAEKERDELLAQMADLDKRLRETDERAVQGVEAQEAVKAMSRAAIITGWLESGRMKPAEQKDVEADLDRDYGLTVRMMSRREPDGELAREYGRSDRGEGATADEEKLQDASYAGFMAGMGMQGLATVPPPARQ